MGKLGPLFKGKAKAVGDALKQLSAEEIRSAGDEITVTADGETFKVPKTLVAFGEENIKISGRTIVPHVIEPSYGIDRITYCVMEHAYDEEELAPASGSAAGSATGQAAGQAAGASGSDEEEEESRIVMRFKNVVAPYQAAVHPLMGKPELSAAAKKLFKEIIASGIMADYDESGTIGKRYRRNDEIGIPYSITIDFDTIEKQTVTIRDRDTMKQIIVPAHSLADTLKGLLAEEKTFEKSGKIISR